jgi:hypothetical protein
MKEFSAIAFLLLSGCAVSAPKDEAVSRVSVSFVNPEKFTDARRAELAPTSAGVLRELEKFFIETGGPYLPETMKLNIQVTDIDLAGDFELFRGPEADRVRVVKDLYPPRISLEFRVTGVDALTVKEGKRNLTDLDYQRRAAYPREDYLRYEKQLLRDWMRHEFGPLKTGGTVKMRREYL